MEEHPLFHIEQKSTKKLFIVVDFVKGTGAYLIICKPHPQGKGAEGKITENDIIRQVSDRSVPEEIFTASECNFVLFKESLNYGKIAQRMRQRAMVSSDLKMIKFPEEHLKQIKIFLNKPRQ